MPDTDIRTREVSAVRRALAMIQDLEGRLAAAERAAHAPVAVVGVGCRFPGGASDPEGYWELLAGERDGITEVPPDRWDVSAFYDPDPDRPGKTNARWGGFLPDVDAFDAGLFGISRREAEAMDPQHRLLLEVSWRALEHAGLAPDGLTGSRTGVFVGLSTSDYATLMGAGRDASWIDAYASLGNAASIAAGRVAYAFGFQGPAMVVDTACSSSLAAVHLAVQALRAGECGLALAAGVNLTLAPELTINFTKARMLAADGRCKTFDAAADGYVRGEGCGVVVLKLLSSALSEGDRVLAVLRGSALNQDGRSAGLTAPHGPSQEAVIRSALADGGIPADAVDYVEAHGTGTALGDPIEMHALAGVFGGRTRALLVGSVKTNIGHTEAAAGIAGLIKAVLMLREQAVPASLHFARLNPHIALGGTPIAVPTRLSPCALGVVGVSSFGFSGTNAHVVLERAEVAGGEGSRDPRPVQILALSARDPGSLEALASGWAEALAVPGSDLAALCHTAGVGRARFAHRLAVVASDAASARSALSVTPRSSGGRPRVAFLCTGQGSTYGGMAAGLAESSAVFRAVLERCDAVMGLDRPLSALLGDDAALGRTDIAQPALYAVSAGLGALWRSWGIEPVAVLGHSVGEYAAAHLGGVLTLEDGARLIAARGRLMQALPEGGAMAALLGPAEAARALVGRHAGVEIAGENSPTALTVAGPEGAIERLLADPALSGGEMVGQKLPLRHAFHSRLVDPMLAGLGEAADGVLHHAPVLPVVGNLDGSVVRRHDGAYWRAHARGPVRFASGLATLAGLGVTHLVELGAQPVLSGFARGCAPGLVAVPSLVRPRAGQDGRVAGWTALAEGLARLWRDGAAVDWAGYDAPFRPRVVDAPGYPFQRQRYWLPDPMLDSAGPASVRGAAVAKAASAAAVPEQEAASRAEHGGAGTALPGGRPASPLVIAGLGPATGLQRPEGAVLLRAETSPTPASGQSHTQQPSTPDRDPATIGDIRVTGFYDELASAAGHADELADGSEGHLTFGLLPSVIPGFSWVRALFAGSARPEEYATLRRAQAALKEAIFAPVDFSQARRVLDFGCGHAADMSALARRHPHLLLDGCTISSGQVAVGRRRVARLGLADRIRIHHRDSARDPFPGRFDVIFGVEVSGLIEDKAALFDNIAAHLEPGGALVIADFVATGDGIANPDTASFTSTAEEWASLLAERHLRLTECTEVSTEIAAFLDDPGFTDAVERVVAEHGLSALTRRHLLSNDNIGRALRAGVMRYVLLTARHDRTAAPARLLVANRARLAAPDRWMPAAAWQDWFYRVAWEPWALDAAIAAGEAVLARVGEAAQAIDGLARAWIGAADLPSVRPVPKYRRLHQHLLTLQPSPRDPSSLPVPDLPEALLLQRCGPRLREVLEGRADPLDALFGDGGDAAAALYAASPCARAINGVAAAALDGMLAGRGPVTVLEIGCGTGGTTSVLQPRLRAGDRYVATDVSAGFVSALRSRLPVEGGVLDITRPPDAQGFTRGSAEIVVAANVLHATPSLRETLAHASALLAPDGELLLVENSGTLPWGDLTFGLTEGMWAFVDTDLRPGHALMPPARWIALLDEMGFETSVHQPATDRTAALTGQFVLTARRRLAVPDRVWVVPPIQDAVTLLDEALDVIRDAAAQPVPPRVWIVTQGARAVVRGERPDPVQATLWGMANAIAIEHPELRLTLVDADGPFDRPGRPSEEGTTQAVQELDWPTGPVEGPGREEPAPVSGGSACPETLIRSRSAETRLAIRAGRVLRARIERLAPPQVCAAIRADATYLVTGGLGGVGFAVARWLAAAGARSIALLGRTIHPVTGFPPEVTLSTHACDVADEGALSAVLSELAGRRPTLQGVFHAAGVLDDAVLAQQTPERIVRVLRPKMDGARLLDRLTRHLPIEHFVLFSSSATLVGSAAQANHAAANAWLDALAERRRAEGLPGLSIAWGAWAEIGAAARAGEGVARRGLLPMPPDAALAALGHAMTSTEPVLGVLDVDWGRFLGRFPTGLVPPLFAAVAPPVAEGRLDDAQPTTTQGWREELQAVPEAQREASLQELIRETVGRILGLTAGTLPAPNAPLRELGLDSLMTIELRNALATACGSRLPATLVFEHPTCTALAAHLGATVFAGLLPVAAGDGLDALDAGDLARLLEQELGAAGEQLAGAP
jgi:acyl transferase domain-containing protein/SAM-dependent methyltransferase/acyl carrier protein